MIKAVIFDFFSVLAVKDTLSFGKTYFPNDPEKTRQNQLALDQLGRGEMSYDKYIDMLAQLGGVSRKKVLEYTEDYHPNKELLEYIGKYLKPKYKLGIISNSGQDWVQKILGPTNRELFDDIILSYKVKLIKPEPEIYKLSAKNLGINTDECVFVDDILTYCQGAEAVGMNIVWYQNFHQMKADLEKILG